MQLEDKSVLLALSVLMQRIDSLPQEDRDDLFELMKENYKANDEEEKKGIYAGMEEILLQTPVSAKPMVFPDRLSTGRQNWANHVAKTIKELREKLKMPLSVLAWEAQVPENYLIRLENAEYTPNQKPLERIANVLGVSVEQLDPPASWPSFRDEK